MSPVRRTGLYLNAGGLALAAPKETFAPIPCDVGGVTEPDMGTVDALARLQLAARRLGCSIRLRHASRELQELLSLAGLSDVLPCRTELVVEAEGQAEEREETRGVEEEGDPGDPTR